MSESEVLVILAKAKELAQRYRSLTGKPLGITGEVAAFEAGRLLGLTLVPARQAGRRESGGRRSSSPREWTVTESFHSSLEEEEDLEESWTPRFRR